jgi:hypothetical protein
MYAHAKVINPSLLSSVASAGTARASEIIVAAILIGPHQSIITAMVVA